MLRKTGKDIYKLRKTKTASKGQLDVHAFKEKMAFFTNLKNDVPVVPSGSNDAATLDLDEDEVISESSTLKHDSAPFLATPTSSRQQTVTPPPTTTAAPSMATSHSSETVNTLTEDTENSANSNERFSYVIDPDIGVIV